MGEISKPQRPNQAELARALKAWVSPGLTVGEAAILPDGTIRIRSPEDTKRAERINPADLIDP
ncbi:MAG: hypothetical protein CML55_01310 [Rhodobacteraceae bacterium]|nr:hypothetical protein [Paracoccaceae bacterium]|tara:strand:- start:1261 stop:1449 length:189 start_codon:yes stop_codon:yes gene_type:complete